MSRVTERLDACPPALYRKPWPRDSLSEGVNHFCECWGGPSKLATECLSLTDYSTASLDGIISVLGWPRPEPTPCPKPESHLDLK
jgi:hypothetical protein